MPRVIYIQHDGSAQEIDVKAGETVMQGAIDNMIDGIAGECGGGLACGTCPCYADEAWTAQAGEPSAAESEMLESVVAERKPNSRLSCQITASEALDGVVVHLPETQY